MNTKRPNIILIMADQMASDVIGALGHPAVKTPNLDKLVQTGTTFDNCYCNSPLCAPSRAALMSGTLVRNNEVYDNAAEFRAGIPTFVHVLRNTGYNTALAGKMHFVGPDQLHGFEERLTTDIYPSDFGWTPDWRIGVHANKGTSVTRAKNAGISQWNDQLSFDEEVLSCTLKKIRQVKKEEDNRPFFICASFTHPHDPFVIMQEYWDLYEDTVIPLPKVSESTNMHPYNQWVQTHHEIDQYKLTDQEIRRARRAYYAMVSYFDDKVGSILSELKRLDLMQDTIVILTSDHGEMLGEHGMWYKRTFYDQCAKVPLIISWPNHFLDGKREKNTVSLIDLAATIVHMAQVDNCEVWQQCIDGDSFHKLLFGEDPEWKDEAVCEYSGEGIIHPMIMMRKGSFKYVHVHRHTPLLFDLKNDPYEVKDLSEKFEYEHIVHSFQHTIQSAWDGDTMEKKILKSQKERIFIHNVMNTGVCNGWDYVPNCFWK